MADLFPTPMLYPQKYDPVREAVYLVPLDAAGYRAASFLDDRMLAAGRTGTWQPFDAIAQAGATGGKPLHFIFHTGHVGSTLLSRLIDEAGGVLGLREPLPLRTLAEMQDAGDARFDARLAAFLALWRRGFAETATVVLKATSATGRLAPALLAASPQSKAVYLNLRAEPYLVTLLAGANTMVDLKGFESGRRARLRAMLGGEAPPTATVGELAAMSWLTESLTRARALEAGGPRMLALDFDVLLANLPAAMTAVLAHLEIAAPPGFAQAIVRSPVLTRYSKAPQQFEYSPAFRAKLLAQTRREQAAEIRRGLAWLEAMARRDPRVAALG